jgi:hypothetical protein
VRCSEATGKKGEFNPHAYEVYGPKIIATRGYFQDRALESRCLTEETGGRPLREDVPISLPPEHKEEALHLRNQLLLYRFRKLATWSAADANPDRAIEPRLNQIFRPLLSIIEDPNDREEMRALARRYHGEMISERGMDLEAHVLEAIRDLKEAGRPLVVKDIASWLQDRHGEDYERKINPKWIGSVLRKKLQLRTSRSKHGYILLPEELSKLPRLYERYGITTDAEEVDVSPPIDPDDVAPIG